MIDSNSQHVVIAGMPLVDSMHAPLAAPAVLKASLTCAGILSTALDLNIEVLLKIKSHPEYNSIKKFFDCQDAEDHITQEVSKILFYCAHRILQHQPTIIALSLLTHECQNFTLWLCLTLRQLAPKIPIVIGGPGIKHLVADYSDTFRNRALSLGLIDHYISGDGDRALVEYVNENYSYPGINSDIWQPVSDLDSLPYPDWSDYNFFLYSQSYMPVVDSKGCVRNCEFCDVIEYWSKFQSRKAENIFKEMLHQIDLYNFRDFDFRSSLSNGNLKEFKKLLDLMYQYNQHQQFRPNQLSWNASFIVRQKSQHPEEMWQQMGATHATLSLGIESVVPHIRTDLGKHFGNEDIDYHLEMAEKYNVKLILMIITGYPTETLEDYEFTKQWFRDRARYNQTISRLFLSKAIILPGTQLHKNIPKHGIILVNNNLKRWETVDVSESARAQYHQELENLCRHQLGFNLDAY